MKFGRVALAVACAVATSGCASIIRGTEQDFTIQTDPAGARAQLSTGEVCEATPCTLERSRNEVFSVTLSHEGYATETHEIRNPWSRNGTTTGIVGNAILGGGIGIGVDAMTGANRDLTPNPLVVTMTRISAPAPAAAAPAAEASALAAPPVEAPAAEPSALGPPPAEAPAAAPAAESTPAQ